MVYKANIYLYVRVCVCVYKINCQDAAHGAGREQPLSDMIYIVLSRRRHTQTFGGIFKVCLKIYIYVCVCVG